MKKFWNLVILVLAATLVFQLYQAGKLNNIRASVISLMMPTNTRLGPVETTTTVVPASTPVFAAGSEAPAPEAAATPFFAATPEPTVPPVAAAAPPTEAVVASPTPPAKPEEIDLGSVDRRYWPRMVKLSKDMQFSIVDSKGRLSGQVAAPAGVMVKLLEIRGAKLVVAMPTGSAPQPVDMADTDIQERLREIMKAVGSSAAGSSTAPATPASTPWTPKLNDRGRAPFQTR